MCEVIERFLDVKVVSFMSAMPSTTFSFFINPSLFVKTRSRILLAFPCLRVGSLTCWISPCSSTRERVVCWQQLYYIHC